MSDTVPPFDRRFFASAESCSRIGEGSLGGKAGGLISIRKALAAVAAEGSPEIEIGIPRMVVVATSMFDAFIQRNGLQDDACSGLPDERIAHLFQNADMPVELLGDLRALMDEARTPLAIRSSSLLEDAMYQPFAGVYETKLIPNNQHDPDVRFRKLLEAIKFVYASTFFAAARSYVRATQRTTRDEKMAVIIQEVVGRRHGERFYPDISGVARSVNFYARGHARPDEGVVNLALGLGKAIVDGGVTWSYSPAHPKAPPPYSSTGDLLRNSQTRFWAVNMGRPPEYNPIAETEYLVQAEITDAERDGTLGLLASTYDPQSDRLSPGVGARGARILNFSPLLVGNALPLNAALQALLQACREATGSPVEVEFALTFVPETRQARLGFLQVRPMVVSDRAVEVEERELAGPDIVVASDAALGNGADDSLLDIVYVKPAPFEARLTPVIAQQVAQRNTALHDEGRRYVLIGFGRWGSSDPWLGIPVNWGQICGARVIVEASLARMNVEASQGAHFFHNITSFQVPYLTVQHLAQPGIDWAWLDGQEAAAETEYIRHVRLPQPVRVRVDGSSGRGGIWRPR